MFDWSIIQSQARTFIPPFLEFKYSFESDISPTLWGNPAVSLSLGAPSFICNAVISLSDNSTECVVFKGRRQREHCMVLGGRKWGIDIQSFRHSSSSSAERIRIWSSVFVSHLCQLRVAGVANVSTWYLETTRTKQEHYFNLQLLLIPTSAIIHEAELCVSQLSLMNNPSLLPFLSRVRLLLSFLICSLLGFPSKRRQSLQHTVFHNRHACISPLHSPQ